MFSLPAKEINLPISLSKVREIFKSACLRRGIRQNSYKAQDLSTVMLSIYAMGIRDSSRFRDLANFYP